MRTIGTNYLNYNTLRNFAGVDVPEYSFRKVHDVTKLVEYPLYRLFDVIPLLVHNVFLDFPPQSVDAFHFFNTTYVGSRPWILTIENIAPHFGNVNVRWKRLGLKRMADNNCKCIIAMSQNSFNRQSFFLENHRVVRDAIISKMRVLHPSQRLFRQSMSEKTIDVDNIKFTFVGKFFFHKGGLEILKAASRLFDEGFNFTLNIVSSFKRTNWLDNHFTSADEQLARQLIAKYSNIVYKPILSNQEVLQLMKASDVGLLPSYGESYGYSVLECQAYGCPVITTNVWALEEINNDLKGWILNVPRVHHEGGFVADLAGADKQQKFSEALENELYQCLRNIIRDPSIINLKGEKSLDSIRVNHSPERFARSLASIYDDALSNIR